MKHSIIVTKPITEDIISDLHISNPDISNLIDYDLWTSMHKIFKGTEEEYKKYMQTEADTLYITKEAYDSLITENKVYHMFDYSANKIFTTFKEFGIKDLNFYIYPIVFLKKPYDEEYPYHIYRLINYKAEDPHLIDVTHRIRFNYKYWINTYAPIEIDENTWSIQIAECTDKESYVYGTKEEALTGLIEYLYDECIKKAGLVNSEYMLLDCKYTYDKLYDKIYKERLEQLSKDIEKELSNRKEKAKSEKELYQSIMEKLLECKQEAK